jgi:hypothetical protein
VPGEPTRHPLLEFLEKADMSLSLRTGTGRGFVDRVEKRELRSSTAYAGSYNAYFIAPSSTGADKFHCVDHTDVSWAVGALIYALFRRHLIPVDEAHLGDCLFSVQDVLLKQEAKSWFRAEFVQGKCVARPIVTGFDASSPGRYFTVNDFVQTPPASRGALGVILRLDSILIPRERCGEPQRDFTLRSDAGDVRYRDAESGAQVTSRETGGSPSPEEFLRRQRGSDQDS